MVYPCPKHSSLFQVTKQSKRGTTQRFMWSRWGVGWRRNNWIQLHEHTVQYGASFSIWGHEWDLFAPQCFWKQTHCIGLGWGSWSKHCAFWLVWNIPKITATLGWRHSTRCIVHCCVLWRHSRCALHYRVHSRFSRNLHVFIPWQHSGHFTACCCVPKISQTCADIPDIVVYPDDIPDTLCTTVLDGIPDIVPDTICTQRHSITVNRIWSSDFATFGCNL